LHSICTRLQGLYLIWTSGINNSLYITSDQMLVDIHVCQLPAPMISFGQFCDNLEVIVACTAPIMIEKAKWQAVQGG